MEDFVALRSAILASSPIPIELGFQSALASWFEGGWRVSAAPSFDHLGGHPPPPLPPVREHGAALGVLDGSLIPFLLRPGGEDRFAPELSEVKHPAFAGYYHTHPYPRDDLGRMTTGVAFSDADLAWILSFSQPGLLLFAHSGRYLFLVARAVGTPSGVSAGQVSLEYVRVFESNRARRISFPVCVLRAVVSVCVTHGLVFYAGKLPTNTLKLYHDGRASCDA